jgi:WD40 repeat protein
MLILTDSSPGRIHTLAFSPDGRTLASVNGRTTSVALWDLDTRQKIGSLPHGDRRPSGVAFSPDGSLLATVASCGELALREMPSGRLIRQAAWQRFGALARGQVVFSPDGQWIATNMHDQEWRGRRAIQLFSLKHNDWSGAVSGSRQRWPTGHWHEVSCLAYSPDGRILATGSFDRHVQLHDLVNPESLALHQGMKVHYLAFSPDGATFASGSPGGLVKVWHAESGKKRNTLKGQAKPLYALCYSPDGKTIATAGGEGTVVFWDVATARSRTALDWGIGEVYAVAFAPDGMRAAAGGAGKIVVWDIDDWDL